MGKETVSASWVHERSLPSQIIKEFEDGVKVQVNIENNSHCSQSTFTASVSAVEGTPHAELPPTKRKKVDRWIAPGNSGYVIIIVHFLFYYARMQHSQTPPPF